MMTHYRGKPGVSNTPYQIGINILGIVLVKEKK